MNESEEHIALVELFRGHPELAVRLVVQREGLELPAGWSCRVVDPVNRSGKRTADTVILVVDGDGARVLVIVLEVQLRRERRKRRTFASYMWLEQDRWDCDSCVLVVSPHPAVVRWACQPMLVRGSVTQLLAVGPGDVPWISDAAEARRDPALAVLSAAMHGRRPDAIEVLRAAFVALTSLSGSASQYYSSLVLDKLSREELRSLSRIHMQEQIYEDEDDPIPPDPPGYDPEHLEFGRQVLQGFQELLQQREREAAAKAAAKARRGTLQDTVLRLCAVRGLGLGKSLESRVNDCQDVEQLAAWLERAAVATRVEDVFG